jgi:putative acetyltransferase
MNIALEHPDQPEVIGLIAELDAYQGGLYPAESNHGIALDALAQKNVLFAVARNESGQGVGCGAVVLQPAHGEIKRMFVSPAQRGRGIAKALLAFLEAEAGRTGCELFMLETGTRQPEALALYDRAGYARRGPFANYTNDPLSVFMQKQIRN